MSKTLADILRSYIPDGDGYNSEYAHNLNAAADAIESQQSAPAGWPTDDMVVRGAEELHDSLRMFGIDINFDTKTTGTEIQQEIVESVFNAMLAAAPKAECTNSDSWNCKYCNKTKDCEALKDPRNFAAPKAEPVQRPVAQVSIDVDGSNKRLTWYSHKAMHEIPEWTKLYAAPQPVSDDALVSTLIEALADAIDYLNEPMNSIQHGSRLYSQMGEALTAYHAAMGSKGDD